MSSDYNLPYPVQPVQPLNTASSISSDNINKHSIDVGKDDLIDSKNFIHSSDEYDDTCDDKKMR